MGEDSMAMIGMSVMGSNFAQNFAEKGYHIALFNRTDSVTQEVYEKAKHEPYADKLHPVIGELADLVKFVGETGIYFVMVKDGKPTQAVIDGLLEHVKPGAVIVDCANSNWHETVKRYDEFKDTGVSFFGMGVSGGEEGARHGPSIMPGGHSLDVYNERLKEALEAVSAKAPQDGKPCVAFIGQGGAGHFVKMIHNGIEYADMELIAEAYDFMQRSLGMSAMEISEVFTKWNKGKLESYLIEITAEVLKQPDIIRGDMLVDKILDAAQMKGTGTWTVMSSLELESGVIPIPGIYAAVASRAMSWMKELRMDMSKSISFPVEKYKGDRQEIIDKLEHAMYVAKIASYAQGIHLMQTADEEFGFGGLNIGEIAEIWRDGCIIRAKFLGDITEAYEHGELKMLIADPMFRQAIVDGMPDLNDVAIAAVKAHVPFFAFDVSRAYLLQLTSERLPMNLTQGMRDFFGAHTYKRIDKEGTFHTEWSGNREEKKLD